MGREELPLLSLAEAAALVAQRQVSPVELTEAVLERIERVDPKLNAFITVTADVAMKGAEKAEEELLRGRYRGPLHGIPVALKDLYATRGIRTTCGSKILADWVPDEDAAAWERLRRAGAVLVGKNNLHEFAAGSTTNNAHYGPCRNPWNTEHVPGGSSGGSGAAVAAGLCFMSMGTDTGGSIRSPASLNGVTGLKPTYGLVSRHGIFPLAWTLDHGGPLARTAEDCALTLNAIAGYDARDPASARRPRVDYTRAFTPNGDLKGLRVGVIREHMEEAAEDVEAAVRRAVGALAELGAEVEEVSLAFTMRVSADAGTIISASESASVHEEWLSTRPDDYGPDIRNRFQEGSLYSAAQYHKAQRIRRLVLQEFLDALQRVDVLVGPTNAITAPRIADRQVMVKGRMENIYGARRLMPRLTQPYNMSRLPAISVPCGFGASGLPVGLQIGGRPYDEVTVLRVAHAYQQVTTWHKQRPAV